MSSNSQSLAIALLTTCFLGCGGFNGNDVSTGTQASSTNSLPIVSVATYLASGSAQTATGTIQASSKILTLSSPQDFANGQGLLIFGAGSAFALNQPSAVSAAQLGATGATTYQYALSSFDTRGGFSAPVTTTISNGNAALQNFSNRVQVSFTQAPTSNGTIVWKKTDANAFVYCGIALGNSFLDTGWCPTWKPTWIPATPPSSAQPDWLVTKVAFGGGLTVLGLADAASTSVTAANVQHDDTAAILSAVSANNSSGARIVFPCGTFNISGSITVTSSSIGFSGEGQCSVIQPFGALNAFVFQGAGIATFIRGGFLDNLYIPAYNLAAGGSLYAAYATGFDFSNVSVDHAPVGVSFHDVNDVRMEHDRIFSFWGASGFAMRVDSGPTAAEYSCCFDMTDVYATGFSTSSPADMNVDKIGFVLDGNVATVEGRNVAVSNVPGKGLLILNDTGNPNSPQFIQTHQFSTEFSNDRGIDLEAGAALFFSSPTVHGSGSIGGSAANNIEIASSVVNATFEGGQSDNAGCSGIDILGSGTSITGMKVFNNSAPNRGGTSQSCSGIVLEGGSSSTAISGNTIDNGEFGAGWQQAYPVYIAAGAAHFNVAGNAFANNMNNFVWSSVGMGAGNLISDQIAPPSIASGFGTGATIQAQNGPHAFAINVGSGGTAGAGVVNLPAALNGWSCSATDTSTISATVYSTRVAPTSTTSVTFSSVDNAGNPTAWASGDLLQVMCNPY